MLGRLTGLLWIIGTVWATPGFVAFGLRLDNRTRTACAFSMPDPMLPSLQAIPPRRPWRQCGVNSTRHDNICMRRLSARLARLENSVSALCSAIVHADDVALMERQAAGMGFVYQDTNLDNRRRARWLRRGVRDVAAQYSIALMPPEVKWEHMNIVEEIDTGQDDNSAQE